MALDRTKIIHESHLVSHSNLNTLDLSRYVQFNCEKAVTNVYKVLSSEKYIWELLSSIFGNFSTVKECSKDLSVDCLKK